MKPVIDRTVANTVQLLSVSFSVKPPSLLMTQKPLSFIHEAPKAPKPIERKTYMGLNGSGAFAAGSIIGQIIAEAVIIATVAEP